MLGLKRMTSITTITVAAASAMKDAARLVYTLTAGLSPEPDAYGQSTPACPTATATPTAGMQPTATHGMSSCFAARN
jgi:hypothetical protein